MIEKKIHYCWFGENEKDNLVKKCLSTWKNILPEYEIIEWNEKKINLDEMPLYVQQAYEQKKWAFVSDYVRLHAVYYEGGIYLDTDVELLRSFNPLLGDEGFSGFQHKYGLMAGICGTKKHNPLIMEIMEHYQTHDFVKADGTFDMTATPIVWAKFFTKHGMVMEDRTQILDDGFKLYDSSYFGNNKKSSYLIHHFQATWVEGPFYVQYTRGFLQLILGKQRYNKFASAVVSKFKK